MKYTSVRCCFGRVLAYPAASPDSWKFVTCLSWVCILHANESGPLLKLSTGMEHDQFRALLVNQSQICLNTLHRFVKKGGV